MNRQSLLEMVMEVMRYRKWLIIGLLCIVCVGLILLKPPISLVKTSPIVVLKVSQGDEKTDEIQIRH